MPSEDRTLGSGRGIAWLLTQVRQKKHVGGVVARVDTLIADVRRGAHAPPHAASARNDISCVLATLIPRT